MHIYTIWNIHKTNPNTTLAVMPNTSTGPATVKSLAPRPVMKPSACVKLGNAIKLSAPKETRYRAGR